MTRAPLLALLLLGCGPSTDAQIAQCVVTADSLAREIATLEPVVRWALDVQGGRLRQVWIGDSLAGFWSVPTGGTP